MKTATDIVHSLLRTGACAAIAFFLAPVAQAAFVYTNEAPNGVGDVVALTNALAQANALTDSARASARIWLKPSLYNLSGVYMTSSSHLRFYVSSGGMIAGLGEKPDDTILLGGGETEKHRVLNVDGGGNYGWFTVSNMTVTGGYTSDNGGGIQGNATTRYRHLIVSNNYAAGSNAAGGGGCMRGRAEYCLFAGNRVGSGTANKWGGGFWTDGGGGQQANLIQGAWHCTFSNNWASGRGGGMNLSGKCVDCKFFGNSSPAGAALHVNNQTYTWFSGKFTNTTEITDCTFLNNAVDSNSTGGGIYNNSANNVFASNCVFTANGRSGGASMAHGCDFFDSAFVCNTNYSYITSRCNLSYCKSIDNIVTGPGDGGVIDYVEKYGICTNINSLFKGNVMTSYGRLSKGKTFINCTIVGNDSQNGGNYGYICTPDCKLVNCVLSGNKIGNQYYDIRPIYGQGTLITNALDMVNCVFVKSQAGVGEDWKNLVNCKKVADVKFTDAANGDYTPMTRSPLYDAGCQEPWLLSLVGDKDLAGNPRVFGKRVDIGAYECQKLKPGVMLIFR